MTKLIAALDEPTFEKAAAIVDKVASLIDWYKVGYEAYFGYGERILAKLREAGKSLFLDLKLHDIPNTVARAVPVLAASGVQMLTVHAGGGRAMLAAAAAARDQCNAAGARLRLLAVTVLTSLSPEDLREVGFDRGPHQAVSIRAELAAEVGIDGVICAVEDVPIVRARTEENFLTVCPGIRLAGEPPGDQRRTATPAEAALAGADFIVVGRPITQAPDPAGAAQIILDILSAGRSLHGAADETQPVL